MSSQELNSPQLTSSSQWAPWDPVVLVAPQAPQVNKELLEPAVSQVTPALPDHPEVVDHLDLLDQPGPRVMQAEMVSRDPLV